MSELSLRKSSPSGIKPVVYLTTQCPFEQRTALANYLCPNLNALKQQPPGDQKFWNEWPTTRPAIFVVMGGLRAYPVETKG